MPTETMRFAGHAGALLDARLDLPEGEVAATVLFAHCFTCGKDVIAARRIARRLSAAGFAVLRFDFTGLGGSGGDFAETGFTGNVGDLMAAAAALAGRGLPPALLIGHSLGGAAVLKAARRIASVRAVATIGAPFDPGHVLHHFTDALPRIAAEGAAEVTLAGRPIRIGQGFVEDIGGHDLTEDIGHLHRALLVLHAPLDAVVGIDNATRIFMAARHPKSFVTLDDADHLLSRPADADYAAQVIAAWSARYLDLPAPAPLPGAPEGIVRVTEADPPGYLQHIMAGPHHHLLADEPASLGGTDRGPSPYGLLSAALGACTAMTLRMYARRKGWPVTQISVDVDHDRLHGQDAGTEGRGLDRFRRTIRIAGPLDEDQRARLLAIADKCPVHRTLEAGARVETTLAPEP
jgi:putative redox protein